VVGCSIHQGILDAYGKCAWCLTELNTGIFHLSIPTHLKQISRARARTFTLVPTEGAQSTLELKADTVSVDPPVTNTQSILDLKFDKLSIEPLVPRPSYGLQTAPGSVPTHLVKSEDPTLPPLEVSEKGLGTARKAVSHGQVSKISGKVSLKVQNLSEPRNDSLLKLLIMHSEKLVQLYNQKLGADTGKRAGWITGSNIHVFHHGRIDGGASGVVYRVQILHDYHC
jgi:hypothetical protein